ncbi:MAG: glycosyltransferase, partial [Alcaligenaceae bacterium]
LEAVRRAAFDETSKYAESMHASDAEIDEMGRELAYRAHVLSVVYRTRSWRITRPLRGVANLVRRMLGRQVGELPVFETGSRPPSARRYSTVALAPMEMPELAPSSGEFDSSLPPQCSRRREMLVAADMLPLFDHSAGGLRLKTLLGIMGELGWSISFCSLADRQNLPEVLSAPSGLARYEEVLRQVGVVRFVYGLDELKCHLEVFGRDLSFAFLSFPHVTEALLPLVRSYCPSAKVAYDMVDFHGVRMAREARLRNDESLMRQADRQRDIELACARAADLTFAVNDEEKDVLLALAPEVVVDVLPIVFDIPESAPVALAGRKDVLFIGGFWHRPNGDAICWFADHIWPRIYREEPHAVLRIVGSNPGNEVLALGARPGIEVLGFVPDVGPLLDSHRVSVAPLRWGAGTKGKVGQALAVGLPVVATSVGAEGMGLKDGEQLLVADDETGFAEHVLALLREDELWQTLSRKGREHMQGFFSTQVVKRNLKAALGG